MKTASTNLRTHIEGECLTLAHCWKLTRRDSTVMGFTNHDKDLVVDGITYEAATGFMPTSVDSQASLAVDNLDVEGMLSTGNITEQDILAGKYDFAEVVVFVVNYEDISQGSIALRRGWLGEIELRNKQFVAEVRGLTQRLSQHIGELYSPMCRAKFGDSACGINTVLHQVTGIVSAVISQSQFTDNARSGDLGYFNYGKITFTSGQNNGLSGEVKESRGKEIILALPMPYPIAAGNAYTLQRGCDKTITTCTSRYSNALNFRGEPHVPGLDKVLETAGTRSEWS